MSYRGTCLFCDSCGEFSSTGSAILERESSTGYHICEESWVKRTFGCSLNAQNDSGAIAEIVLAVVRAIWKFGHEVVGLQWTDREVSAIYVDLRSPLFVILKPRPAKGEA